MTLEAFESPLEQVDRSLMVLTRHVVHPDREMHQRSQKSTLLAPLARPGVFEHIVTLEIELGIEELRCTFEDVTFH